MNTQLTMYNTKKVILLVLLVESKLGHKMTKQGDIT
jgi:hypothetical protein